MAYHIQIRPSCQHYLQAHTGLSRIGRLRLYVTYLSTLRHCSDEFREERRLAPGSPYFDYTLLIQDAGRFFAFRFIVDDSAAVAGVLTIVYVEGKP